MGPAPGRSDGRASGSIGLDGGRPQPGEGWPGRVSWRFLPEGRPGRKPTTGWLSRAERTMTGSSLPSRRGATFCGNAARWFDVHMVVMQRAIWIAAMLLGACGEETDDRPVRWS